MMAKRVLIFDIFQRSLRNDPDGSRKDQFKAFLKAIRESDDLVEQLAETYFEQNYHRFKIQEKGGSVQIVGTPVEERRAATIAARQERDAQIETLAQARVNRALDHIKNIILLDLKMPNGKKLRECTGADLAKIGGWASELSTHIGATEVVDKHLNEADVRNVWERYNSPAKKRRSAGAHKEPRVGV